MKHLKSIAVILIICMSVSNALELDLYYGQGCPHCATTSQVLLSLKEEYNLKITTHEVYYNAEERALFISEYERFGKDVSKGGVPTTIIDKETMIIGGMPESQWRALFGACIEGGCPKGAYSYFNLPVVKNKTQNDTKNETQNVTKNETGGNGSWEYGHIPTTDPIEEKNGAGTMTLSVLIGAAIVDSFNPCTIAVMVLLLGAILHSRGRHEALVSGLVFTTVIFIMYMLYGLGIMKAVTSLGLSVIFYMVVTAGALVLAVMEFNAYFNYKPGFMAVEIPMFLRPYVKKVTAEATSPVGVAIAGLLCSIFLLPCSSGPYLMVLGMLAKAATLQTLGYLILYNFFFVIPMLAISLAVYLGKTTVGQIGSIKDKYIRQIHLASGIILFVLFIIMLMQFNGYI